MPSIGRRNFIKASLTASGSLLLPLPFPVESSPPFDQTLHNPANGSFYPGTWLEITADNRLVFTLDKAEMGQNVITSLSLIIAEELWLDPERIVVQFASVGDTAANPNYKPTWGTGGSSSVRSLWQPLRMAGAQLQLLMQQAAAKHWQVDSDTLTVEALQVYKEGNNESISFAELIPAALKLARAGLSGKSAKPRSSNTYRYIGHAQPRLDGRLKVTGEANYSIDTELPGMKVAVLVRQPLMGGELESYDDSAVLQKPGVHKVVPISNGIAIIADHYWQAHSARPLLQVKWKTKSNPQIDNSFVHKELAAALSKPGLIARSKGNRGNTVATSNSKVNAEYTVPFLAHAPMEPMNCTAWLHDGRCEVWAPTQRPPRAVATAASAAELPVSAVTLHTTFIGGSFGRRLAQDYVKEAVEIARTVDYPVKLIWSREDDIQNGLLRPAVMCSMSAALDARQSISSLRCDIASSGKPPRHGTASRNAKGTIKHYLKKFRSFIADDHLTLHAGSNGAADLPYNIESIAVLAHYASLDVPLGAWRSVDHSYNAFFIECFIDELAHSAARDPYQFRRNHLQNSPALLRVLDAAATLAGWGKQLPTGHYQGIACHSCFGSHIALVAQVSITNSTINVHNLYCSIDCGLVIDPYGVESQLQGAIVFGLSAALYEEIRLSGGEIQQSNFHDYPVLRIDQCPEIYLDVIDNNSSPPAGVGEAGTPCVAPAIANAIFAGTGKRLRSLPLQKSFEQPNAS